MELKLYESALPPSPCETCLGFKLSKTKNWQQKAGQHNYNFGKLFCQKSYSQHYYNHPNFGQFCSPKNHMIMSICSCQECCRIRDRLVCSPCLPSSRYHLPPSRVSGVLTTIRFIYDYLLSIPALPPSRFSIECRLCLPAAISYHLPPDSALSAVTVTNPVTRVSDMSGGRVDLI